MASVEIPLELPTILRNFTLSVLRTKPVDIVDYAVDYFIELQQQRRSESLNVTNEKSSFDPHLSSEGKFKSMIDLRRANVRREIP